MLINAVHNLFTIQKKKRHKADRHIHGSFYEGYVHFSLIFSRFCLFYFPISFHRYLDFSRYFSLNVPYRTKTRWTKFLASIRNFGIFVRRKFCLPTFCLKLLLIAIHIFIMFPTTIHKNDLPTQFLFCFV